MKVTATFTPAQVESLRAYQESGEFHPFTCCDHQTMTVEVDGLHCPKCGRVQAWCHRFMADGSWQRNKPDLFAGTPPPETGPHGERR